MKCPKCRLYNPDNAMRCDCGYDFDTGEMKESFLGQSMDKPSIGLLVIGWIFAFGGGLIGILVSCYIAFGKNASGYKYNPESRKMGRIMLIFSVIMSVFWILLYIIR